jgi:beta-glucuronidase
MFREMVFKDYNRPSILFWSTSNECKEETNRMIYNQTVVDDLRNNYDDGRLVTQSSAGDRPGPRDITQGPLDAAGWTLYFGIFHGSTYYSGTVVFLAQASGAFPDKPIIDTEFGYWSSEDNSSLATQVTVFNETFKAFKFFSPLNTDGTINPNGFLIGTTWWCVFDWYSHGHPHGFQSMGLVSMDRQFRKPVYNNLKEIYAPYYSHGGMAITGIDSKSSDIVPDSYSLTQNFPNPFNPSTQINFNIPELSEVNMTLYNAIGEKIYTILDTVKNGGTHSVVIDGSRLSSGVYLCKMHAKSLISGQNYYSSIKVMLIK